MGGQPCSALVHCGFHYVLNYSTSAVSKFAKIKTDIRPETARLGVVVYAKEW
jgi:hypothetical protein